MSTLEEPSKGADWDLKLCALMHDPPLKAFRIRDHRDLARRLMRAFELDCSRYEEAISRADQLASAMDRIPALIWKRGDEIITWGEFKPELYHPLSSRNMITNETQILSISLKEDGILADKRDLLSSAMEIPSDVDGIIKRMEEKLREVHRRLKGDRKREFLWLWRCIDSLHGEGGFRGLMLSWLPADTRIPDHTIYDHLVTSSSLTVENPALVAVDIGGVQKFILQSRKVRDLWASSYLVSMLSMAGIMVVMKELGPDALIYPDLRGNPLVDLYLFMEGVLTEKEIEELWGGKERFAKALLVPSIPGSFTFIAPRDRARVLAIRIKESVESFFPQLVRKMSEMLGLRSDISEGLPHPLTFRWSIVAFEEIEELDEELKGCGEDRECIKKVLLKLVPAEVSSWESEGVVYDMADHLAEQVALRNTVGGYGLKSTFFYPVAYGVLQARIAAKKMLTDFVEREEPSISNGVPIRRRCRLCGQRNPVTQGRGRNERESWRALIESLRNENGKRWAGWLLSEDEPLCPICLLKRLLRSFTRDENSLIYAVWGQIFGREAEEIRGIMGSDALGISGMLMNVARDIPTLDDVASLPLKEKLKEGKGEREVEIDEEIVSWEDLREHLLDGIAVAIWAYNRMGEEDEDRRFASFIIAEIGHWWPSILDRLGVAGESTGMDILEDFVVDKFEDPLNFPGSLLYTSPWENLLAAVERLSGKETDANVMEKIKSLKDLIRHLRKLSPHISNYVAFFLSDGDKMGEWVSGRMFIKRGVRLLDRVHSEAKSSLRQEMKFEVARLMTPSLHRTLSRILHRIAQDIYPSIVEGLGGVVFYSGGDDLLAVVPAERALTLAEAVHSAFNSELVKTSEGLLTLGMGSLATVSSGVVIAHRLLPMSELLDRARLEEEIAKGEEGRGDGGDVPPGSRDRVSLVRLSRGLSEQRAVIPGSLLRVGGIRGLAEMSSEIFGMMGDGKLSKSFLRDMLYYLEIYGRAYDSPDESRDFLEGLIERCVERNLHADEKERDSLKERIMEYYRELINFDVGELKRFEQHPLVHIQRALLMMSKEMVGGE